MRLTANNSYFSPASMISTWLSILDIYGDKAPLTESRYKSAREAYITSLFCLGLQKQTGVHYWLRATLDGSTPDSIIISFHSIHEMSKIEILPLEIFEWEQHSKIDLFEAIKNKLRNKNYPPNYILLCYCHGRTDETDLSDVAARLQSLEISVCEIWFLANILNNLHEFDFHGLAKLYPTRHEIYFNAIAEFEATLKQPQMLIQEGKFAYHAINLKKA